MDTFFLSTEAKSVEFWNLVRNYYSVRRRLISLSIGGGVVVGGGLETPVRRGLSMLLDVKYNLGLRDLNADPAILGHFDPIKTKNFIMSMGVIIDIE